MTRGEILQREVLGKSIICSSDIQIDEIFSEENIEIKSPARGLSPQHFYEIFEIISINLMISLFPSKFPRFFKDLLQKLTAHFLNQHCRIKK